MHYVREVWAVLSGRAPVKLLTGTGRKPGERGTTSALYLRNGPNLATASATKAAEPGDKV